MQGKTRVFSELKSQGNERNNSEATHTPYFHSTIGGSSRDWKHRKELQWITPANPTKCSPTSGEESQFEQLAVRTGTIGRNSSRSRQRNFKSSPTRGENSGTFVEESHKLDTVSLFYILCYRTIILLYHHLCAGTLPSLVFDSAECVCGCRQGGVTTVINPARA